MSTNEIKLKPVRDLLDANFFIPSYQRGYRWTARWIGTREAGQPL